jgi:hypothetical protein
LAHADMKKGEDTKARILYECDVLKATLYRVKSTDVSSSTVKYT